MNPLRLWPAHNVLDVSIVCRTGRDIDTAIRFVPRRNAEEFLFRSVLFVSLVFLLFSISLRSS